MWNIADGGNGGSIPGRKCSIETRKKISKGHKGQIAWNKRKCNHLSKETIQKMSIAALRPRDRSKQILAMTEANKERIYSPHTKETREKIRLKLLGRHPSEEARRKMQVFQSSRKVRGHYKPWSLQARKNMSKATQLAWRKRKRV